MSELLVAGFQGTHRAAEVLNQIVDLDTTWAINLKDAVAVYRTKSGRFRVDESVQPTSGEGAAWGGLLGTLIGAVLALPFTAGASSAVAAAAVGAGALTFGATGAVIGFDDATTAKEQYGISEKFVEQVGGMVQPGQSAVFMLADSRSPAEIAERFRNYGATILRTTLPADKAQRLQQVIGAQTASAR